MTFANLGPVWLLGGLLGLAALLFLMQRLRVRHRRVPVVTTLFWHEAIEEARARRFTKRFRHPWAYALILAVAALLWLASADPRPGDSTAPRHVVLLDASAGMGREGQFAAAVAHLEEILPDIPSAKREVVLCGAIRETLLAPGEHAALLRTRLGERGVDAAPCSFEAALRGLGRTPDEHGTVVTLVGDGVVREETLALLPEGLTVRRSRPESVASSGNRGVVAAGVSPARSGAWDRVDVLFDVRGMTDDDPYRVLLAGAEYAEEPEIAAVENGRRLVFRDVPARGGESLRFALSRSDPLDLDDGAEVTLPDRSLLRVSVAGGVPPIVRSVLDKDPAVLVTDDDATLAVRVAGDGHREDLPALELVPAAQQELAIVLEHAEDDDVRAVLENVFDRLGLDQVDVTEVATEMNRPVVLGVAPGAVRRVAVWSELLSDAFNFTRSRSFPLFIAQSVRWLGGVEDFPRVVAAGRPHPSTSPWDDEMGRPHAPVGAAFVPPSAGSFTSADETVKVSLLDPDATTPPAVDPVPAAELDGGAGGFPWLTVFGLLAVALLGFEWFVFQTGRIP